MRKTQIVHLFRGAPAVRHWSKHQETIKDWTLCGIHHPGRRHSVANAPSATEDASLVSCRYCLLLMRSVSPLTYPKPKPRTTGAAQ